ncbi:MAG: nucleotide exchange factor GrpE [Eubacteriales bacterium]
MMTPDETLNENTAPANEPAVEEETAESADDKKAEDGKGSKKVKKENAELKEKLAAAESELAEQKDKYLRLLAEYDNFRRRSQKEKEGIYTDAYGEALKAILPVADNLELAVRYSEGDKVVEGVKMVLNQLHDALTKLGIEEIETKTFDPNVHNAVMHIEDEAYAEGEIVEVFQKGYRKGEKIIRHAMVKVAN